MLAVVYSQALVFPTDEDCANDIADDENTQTDVVHAVVVVVVVNGKEDETDCADNSSDDAQKRVNLLPNRRVGC